MKKYSVLLITVLCLGASGALAKLPPAPPLTEEARVAAEEKKAKAADAAKKDNEDLARSQDRVAEQYIKAQKARGVVVKPTPIVAPPPPVVAVVPTAPVPAVSATAPVQSAPAVVKK